MRIEKLNCTNQEAAELLTVSANTLRNSRSTGKLCGRETPPFIKMGRKIIYIKSDLLQWLESFPKYSNTSEAKLSEILNEEALQKSEELELCKI